MSNPSKISGIVAVLALVFAAPAGAQTSDPAWLDQLEAQIATDEQCEVGFYIFVNQNELGGLKVQEARVQCVDGRQFDASRSEPATTFTIKECGTRVC